MPQVYVSAATHDLIRAKTRGALKETGQRQADGGWMIELSSDTIARLTEHQMDGESISDTILRSLSTTTGLN